MVSAKAPEQTLYNTYRITRVNAQVHGRATRSLVLSSPSGGGGGTDKGACFLREKPSEAPSVVCAIAVMDAAAVSVPTSDDYKPRSS